MSSCRDRKLLASGLIRRLVRRPPMETTPRAFPAGRLRPTPYRRSARVDKSPVALLGIRPLMLRPRRPSANEVPPLILPIGRTWPILVTSSIFPA